MAGKVIGTALDFGYPGNVTRGFDTVIMAYPVGGKENIIFGAPVAFDAENNCVVAVSGDTEADSLIGVAVRRIGQPYVDDSKGWFYKPGDTCDVLVRGSIAVEVAEEADIIARNKASYDAKNKVFVASGGIEMSNAVFATGKVDGNSVAEITLLQRVM